MKKGEYFNLLEGLNELLPPANSVVAIAISRSKQSKYVVKWALEKLVSEGYSYIKLLHVRPVISGIPTPMGNYIHVSQVRDDVAAAYRKDVEEKVNQKLLPYKNMCTERKARVELVQIESDDIVTAVCGEIFKHKISKLVVGVSSQSFFRKTRCLSSKLSEGCPPFCTVYAISKGKLSSLRPSDTKTNESIQDETSDNSASQDSSTRAESFNEGLSRGSLDPFCPSFVSVQSLQTFSSINQTPIHKNLPSNRVMRPTKPLLMSVEERNDPNAFHFGSHVNKSIAQTYSLKNSTGSTSSCYQTSISDSSPDSQADFNFELEKLRIELRHARCMYAMIQDEAIDTSRMLNEIQKQRLEEGIKLKQVQSKEEESKEVARLEKERYVAARREADFINERAGRESAERKEAEIRGSNVAQEMENFKSSLTGCFYQNFTWEEIISATSSFAASCKIGSGAYGSVYKGSLHHTSVAVKVLHCKEASRTKEFQREVDILSQIRHPHLLSLLGACQNHACLVYEFMENGSLEDVLLKKKGKSPLLWFDRYRIAWEVATTLVFLHNSKPKAIIHRDLKPANILLDRNYVSRIGDVGLSAMINGDPLSVSTVCKDTAVVGTLSYIDPEYQRTGLVSPKSDVYAFGMVILQLLTARSAIALIPMMETAMENDRLIEILDQEGGACPIEETKELALMALKCTELRGRDRPDLCDHILPALEKLKDVAEEARDSAFASPPSPSNHFFCPILKEIMTDPCIAADGYTYDRKAIEAWLKNSNRSPTTFASLPHKNLTPNYTLLSAIMEWSSEKY